VARIKGHSWAVFEAVIEHYAPKYMKSLTSERKNLQMIACGPWNHLHLFTDSGISDYFNPKWFAYGNDSGSDFVRVWLRKYL
jgi:hypothetical protein